jgi:transposase
MVIRRAYKRDKVNSVDVNAVYARGELVKSAVIGLDIAKEEIVACLRWGMDSYERPWSVSNPSEINVLTEILISLRSKGIELKVAMESTGTYGDAVRLVSTKNQFQVYRVSGMHVKNHSETFDGVPSQHDGKDAAVIAELCGIGKGTLWPYEAPSEFMAEINYQVRRMDAYQSEKVQWHGRLESLMARHWPELSQIIKLNRKTVLRLLSEYGSPEIVGKSEQVPTQLWSWGNGALSEAKAENIFRSSKTTMGLPMTTQDQQWLKEIAQHILRIDNGVKGCEKKLRVLLMKDVFWSGYVKSVSAGTLGVILSTIGDPRAYTSAGALLKGCGLNLKEVSSGKRKGELAISKRGPSLIRRWLHFWALRSIQRAELRDWYHQFHTSQYGGRPRSSTHRKMKGLTCLMRKLMKSLWRSMKDGQPFEYSKLIASKEKRKRRARSRTKQ